MTLIREIAQRTGLCRNMVRKYLKSGAVEPRFATPERPSKPGPFAEKLAGSLKTEAGKGRKKRRTLKQLHADLVALGFIGSYNRVAVFAREWRAGRQRGEQTAGRGTRVPLLFQPGQAFQFDWDEDVLLSYRYYYRNQRRYLTNPRPYQKAASSGRLRTR